MTGIDRQASFRHWTASQSGPQGQVAEWLKAADCKSARVSVRWFESSPVHHPSPSDQGSSTPSSATSARMPADAACPPEHAAMGHCTPDVTETAPADRSEEHTSELQSLMRISY